MAQCEKVDAELKAHLQNDSNLSVVTYNTSVDRDGERSEELYSFLEMYQIVSVPAIAVFDDGQVVQLFDNPDTMVDALQIYLRTYRIGS